MFKSFNIFSNFSAKEKRMAYEFSNAPKNNADNQPVAPSNKPGTTPNAARDKADQALSAGNDQLQKARNERLLTKGRKYMDAITHHIDSATKGISKDQAYELETRFSNETNKILANQNNPDRYTDYVDYLTYIYNQISDASGVGKLDYKTVVHIATKMAPVHLKDIFKRRDAIVLKGETIDLAANPPKPVDYFSPKNKPKTNREQLAVNNINKSISRINQNLSYMVDNGMISTDDAMLLFGRIKKKIANIADTAVPQSTLFSPHRHPLAKAEEQAINISNAMTDFLGNKFALKRKTPDSLVDQYKLTLQAATAILDGKPVPKPVMLALQGKPSGLKQAVAQAKQSPESATKALSELSDLLELQTVDSKFVKSLMARAQKLIKGKNPQKQQYYTKALMDTYNQWVNSDSTNPTDLKRNMQAALTLIERNG